LQNACVIWRNGVGDSCLFGSHLGILGGMGGASALLAIRLFLSE